MKLFYTFWFCILPAVAHCEFLKANFSYTHSSFPSSAFAVIPTNLAHTRNIVLQNFCQKIESRYHSLGWGKSGCNDIRWRFDRTSLNGEPLVYLDLDGSTPTDSVDSTTLILGGVHPDELTPIHLVFRFVAALQADPTIYKNKRVIVAPLVNPDGFFMAPIRRTNAKGVDLNRNFPTKDWQAKAIKAWKSAKKKDPRHFPGFTSLSEPETLFQQQLIENMSPDKIVSIHSPLGFLDYDGPTLSTRASPQSGPKSTLPLAKEISKVSNNYKVRDFKVFPGSLGNYAGVERNIPTVTLELSSTDPAMSESFWKEFYPGLQVAVNYFFQRPI